MATERSAVQRDGPVPSRESTDLSVAAVLVAAGAAVLFSVVFSRLLTYATEIVGLDLGFGAIVALFAVAGGLLSVGAQLND